MKVLFTGTFRSGKTTLLQSLAAKEGGRLTLLPEVARKLLEETPGLEKLPEFQDILFAEQVRQEYEALQVPSQVVVCDRGSVDIVAYARVFGHGVKRDWIEWCRTYDRVFVFQKNDVPFTQEIIDADPQYAPGRDWIGFRNQVDAEMRAVLDELMIPYTMLEGTVDERMREVERSFGLVPTTIEGTPRRRKES